MDPLDVGPRWRMGSSVLYRPVAKGVDRALSNDTGSTGREDDYFTKEHEQIPDWRTYWDRKGTWWRQPSSLPSRSASSGSAAHAVVAAAS